MAFQTHVNQDGQWVSQTVAIHTLLHPPARSEPQIRTPSPSPATPCGLLVRTVVESPVIHWMLPAQLRSSHNNDVALIGETFVQISELGDDRQFHHVARHVNLGSRIRNARVLGLGDALERPKRPGSPEAPASTGRARGTAAPTAPESSFPPQLLVLALENGDLVFLFVRERGKNDFAVIESRFSPPFRPNVQPGHHLTIDPSSRFLATGSAEGLFIVYELESIDTLKHQYAFSGILQPVRSWRPRGARGIIHRMEFLYPTAPDHQYFILLLIIVRNHKSKMVTYEWAPGDSLEHVLSEEKTGHTLPAEHEMPLLVIPLTVRDSFLAVSRYSIAVIKDILQGPPNCETLNSDFPLPANRHPDASPPIWASWARPYRRRDYLRDEDAVYLAREDGAVIFYELKAGDVSPAGVPLGPVDCTISTAFTAMAEPFGDVLIVGGDSCPGSVWGVTARETLHKLSTIPNWSPTLDLASTDGPRAVSARRGGVKDLPAPARLFATSGKGQLGNLTECRLGLAATVGLDLDYGEHLRGAWMFPALMADIGRGHYVVLGLSDCTAVLRVPESLDEALTYESSDPLRFELPSRTLAMSQFSDGPVLQVTETSAALVGARKSLLCSHADLFGLVDGTVERAAILGKAFAVSHHTASTSRICVGRVGTDGISARAGLQSETETTCLALGRIGGRDHLITGWWRDGVPRIAVHHLHDGDDGPPTAVADIDLGPDVFPDEAPLGPATSVVIVAEAADATKLAIGFRSGHVVSTELLLGSGRLLRIRHFCDRIARTSVALFPVSPAPASLAGPSVLACCGGNVIHLTGFSPDLCFKTKDRIWTVDNGDPGAAPPAVNSVYCPGNVGAARAGDGTLLPLLLAAGPRILMADVCLRTQMVPRHIPVAATPTRVLHSKALNCLVVAVHRENKPTVRILDPVTGNDMSRPVNGKTHVAKEFAHGLGEPGDRIYGLYEWVFPKDGKKFLFVVVTTSAGRLLVLSVDSSGDGNSAASGPSRRLQYWTRYRKKTYGEPVYCVAGDAEGLVFCVGSVLHWETLDLDEKKLKPMGQYKLDSPATSILLHADGVVHLLTADCSLVVLKRTVVDPGTGEMAVSLVHSDGVLRKTLHFIDVGAAENPRDDGGPVPVPDVVTPITLLSDRYCGIVGLSSFVRPPGTHLATVFSGYLSNSVRRFCRGRTRPFWSALGRQGPRYGRLKSTIDDADVWGASLDGTLRHFTFLTVELWQLLEFMQTLALSSTPQTGIPRRHYTIDGLEFGREHKPTASAPTSLIEGDVLEEILRERRLEILIKQDDEFAMFRHLLDKLEGGKWVAPFCETGDVCRYFGLGYQVLEYLLSPVL